MIRAPFSIVGGDGDGAGAGAGAVHGNIRTDGFFSVYHGTKVEVVEVPLGLRCMLLLLLLLLLLLMMLRWN
jgi:hypothetical protein